MARTVTSGARGHRRATSPTPLPLRFRDALQGRDGLTAFPPLRYAPFGDAVRGCSLHCAARRAGASVAMDFADCKPDGVTWLQAICRVGVRCRWRFLLRSDLTCDGGVQQMKETIISRSRKRNTRLMLKHVGDVPDAFDGTPDHKSQAVQG
jgi:hypothetical protein